MSLLHKKRRLGAADEPGPAAARAKGQDSRSTAEALSIHTMQKWLNSARNQVLQGKCCFLNDVVRICYEGHSLPRFCFETAEFQDEKGNVHCVKVETKTDIVWSAMLYGRRERVLKHLASCLLLGFQLRYKLRPLLQRQYGISLENVLFLTKDSLDEDAFQAVSFVWSLKFVDLPQPHESRVEGVSDHLKDEEIDSRHVFLKIEAFKMTTPWSIISDLDVVLINLDSMAKRISELFDVGTDTHDRVQPGSVAVMQRCESQVVFGGAMEWCPAISQRRHPGCEQSYKKVSYCYALIKPSAMLAARYEAKMHTETRDKGVLGDQELLGQVLHDEKGFFLMHHDFICFPSWWAHDHLWTHRAREIWGIRGSHRLQQTDYDFGFTFLQQFGAVHMSRAFEFRQDVTSLEAKKQAWKKGMLKGQYRDNTWTWISEKHNRSISIDQYIEFLAGFWMALRDEHIRQRNELLKIVTDAIGGSKPSLGLSKMQHTLNWMQNIVVDLFDAPGASSAAATSSDGAPWKKY